MLFAGAAQSVPFTLLGPLNLIVPVINVLLGWVVYDEPMPLDRLIGFGFVWVALVAVMWDQFSLVRRAGGTARPNPGLNDAAAGRTPCGTVDDARLFDRKAATAGSSPLESSSSSRAPRSSLGGASPRRPTISATRGVHPRRRRSRHQPGTARPADVHVGHVRGAGEPGRRHDIPLHGDDEPGGLGVRGRDRIRRNLRHQRLA